MAKGASKLGGGNNAGGKIQSSMMDNDFANDIYGIPKTMAFPSTKSVIERVPSLKQMKESLDKAPEGAIVSFFIGGGKLHEDTVVYEKVGKKSWLVTGLREKDGQVEQYGGSGKLMGSDLLKSFADKHYRAFDSKERFDSRYEQAYKKIKKR